MKSTLVEAALRDQTRRVLAEKAPAEVEMRGRRPGEHALVVKPRVAARKPLADRGEFFLVVPMPDGGWSLTARGVRCGEASR